MHGAVRAFLNRTLLLLAELELDLFLAILELLELVRAGVPGVGDHRGVEVGEAYSYDWGIF